MSSASSLGIAPLYLKSFGHLIRWCPLRKSEAEKWSIGDGFNDYRLLSDYLAKLKDGDKKEIAETAHIAGVHSENDMPIIDGLYLPIVQKGGFPPDEELNPLMELFGFKDKGYLEMMLYHFLFKTTNYGTELRTALK